MAWPNASDKPERAYALGSNTCISLKSAQPTARLTGAVSVNKSSEQNKTEKRAKVQAKLGFITALNGRFTSRF